MPALQKNSGFMRGRMQPYAEDLPNTVKNRKKNPCRVLKHRSGFFFFSFVREYAPAVRCVSLWRVL